MAVIEEMETTPKIARIIDVFIEEESSGMLFATSPDMPGLMVAEPDMDSLLEEIPKVIKALVKAEFDLDCTVIPARRRDRADTEPAPWVAVPMDILAHANQAA